MTMGWLAWIIFGALAGWVASLIAGTNQRQGCIMNIVVGIVGAFIGGALMRFITGNSFDIGFDLASFGVAVLGAVVLLVIVGLIRG
jgi:uncharacterized membrane protein YeaQ/YmgE (transglycosylase-associated protein family)